MRCNKSSKLADNSIKFWNENKHPHATFAFDDKEFSAQKGPMKQKLGS